VNPRHLDSKSLRSTSRIEQPSTFFTMNCLLCSRTQLGLLTERDNYAQDVDVYLEQLLATFADLDAFERTRRYLSKYDGEVFKRLRRQDAAHVRYTVFRTASDFLLVSAGTFQSPPIRRGRGKQEPIEEGYIGRGKTYYHFAYSYSQRLHRSNAVIPDVLEKLALGFDRYARILAHMRGEQKEDILARLTSGEVFVLERIVNREQAEERIIEVQDDLLDAISEHRRAPSAESRTRVARLASELTALRPGFRFDLARLDAPDLASLDQPEPSNRTEGERPRKRSGLDTPTFPSPPPTRRRPPAAA
jgi:hypothetical protein